MIPSIGVGIMAWGCSDGCDGVTGALVVMVSHRNVIRE